MKIDDNGIVRDMTPEEKALYLAQMAKQEAERAEETPAPQDYEAVKALLERYGVEVNNDGDD